MKKLILFIIIASCSSSRQSYGQKPVIDLNAVKNWEELSSADLTSNGAFGFYHSVAPSKSTIVIKATDGSWSVNLPGVKKAIITNNGKYLFYQRGPDSIGVFQFSKKSTVKNLPGVLLDAIYAEGIKRILWRQKVEGGGNDLHIWSEKKENSKVYKNIVATYPNISATKITIVKLLNSKTYGIDVVDFVSGETKPIWTGNNLPYGLISDLSSRRFAFFISNSLNNQTPSTIVIVNGNSVKEISNSSLNNGVISSSTMKFSESGKSLIFSACESIKLSRGNDRAPVHVWNYKDNLLPVDSFYNTEKWMLYDLAEQQVLNLTSSYDEEIDLQTINDDSGNYIVYKGSQQPNELQLDSRDTPKRKIVLRSIKDTHDIVVADDGYYSCVSLSPRRRFVTYFNRINRRFYSYDITSKRTCDISLTVPEPELLTQNGESSNPITQPVGDCGWLTNDEGLLICDRFDIWLVDPLAQKAAICITGKYGKTYNVRFSLFQTDNIEMKRVYGMNSQLLLLGTNLQSFEEGFTTLRIGKNSTEDIKINFEKVHYYWLRKYNDSYLAGRSSDTSQLNCFTSKDLNKFISFSELAPQKKWNWYTKELINYQMLDGKWNKGILYKPENFDSTKRYPVIFHMYEILSENIFMYFAPRLSVGPVVPAWMCSQGYLIFQPDIQFTFGEPGQCAYNSVVSAANYLSKFSWVDSTKMGLSGGSHGAYSVNYILTKTNIFAAAAPTDGMVNEISGYNTIRGGASRQYLAETSQERMGGTLWDRPEAFIRNSPIFGADKVTTPVLIMHNRNDDAVPWSQGLEWYLGLRRLGKKVWMLEYDGEGHGVHSEVSRIDFTKRLDQFFAHFLKNEKPPMWMTRGIRELSKEKDREFSLDEFPSKY